MRILCGNDFSAFADAAARVAAKLAGELGAELHIISVIPPAVDEEPLLRTLAADADDLSAAAPNIADLQTRWFTPTTLRARSCRRRPSGAPISSSRVSARRENGTDLEVRAPRGMITMHNEPHTDANGSTLHAQQRAKALAEQLKTLAESALAKNRHASGDVQAAVKVLTTQLARVAEKIETSGTALAAAYDEARVQRHLALLDARDRLALLGHLTRTALTDAIQSANQSSTFIAETARVKLALARLDAADLAASTRRAIVDEGRHIERKSDDLLRTIEALVGALKNAGASLTDGNAAPIGLGKQP